MATEAIQSEYQILFNDAVKSVNTFINTLDSKLASAGNSTKSDISSKIESGFDGLGGRLGRIFDTAFGTVLGGAIQNGIGQINNLLTSGFDATINFEAQISSIKALTGATGAELQKITNASLQAGKDTKFSALEAAQGFEELLKAGVSLDAVLSGGLTGALDLAVAGELSVGDAAQIASTGLNTFAKDGLNVAEVGNILAGAANVSATNVSELKFALSAVGVVAAQSGQSLKGTSTALALFAQNGLKGSDAGTSLKTFLNNLIPTTKSATEAMKQLGIITETGANQFINANGSFKSIKQITEILNTSTQNLTESQKSLALETIFGSDAIRAAGILAKTTGADFDQLTTSIDKIKAADVAKEKLNNLKGAFETLRGSIETNQILLLSGLQPALLQLTKGFDSFINSIDFSKAGASLNNFANQGLIELGNLYNLLFKGDFTGLFGLGKDSKVVDFLFNIRDAFLNTVSFIQNNPFKFSFPNFTPLLESISGFGNSVIQLIDKIANSNAFKSIVVSIALIANAIIQIGLPALINQITNLFILISSNQPLLNALKTSLELIVGVGIIAGLTSIASLLLGVAIALAPFVLISVGIVGLVYAFQNFQAILAKIQPIINFLSLSFQNLFNYLGGGNIVLGFFNTIWTTLTGAFNFALPIIVGIIAQLVLFAIQVGVLAGYMINQLYPIFLQIVDAVSNLIVALQPLINTFVAIAGVLVNVLLAGFNLVFPIIGAIVTQYIGAIGRIFAGLINIIAGVINVITSLFRGDFSQAWEGLKEIFKGGVQIIIGIFQGIIAPFRGVFDGILNLFNSFNLFSLGDNLVQGLINGIAGSIGGIYNTLAGGITSAIDGAKKLLRINSPSKVFFEIGVFTGKGLMLGLEKYTPEITKAFDNLVNIPSVPNLPNINSIPNNINNRSNQTNVNNNQSSQNNSNNNYTNYGNDYQMSAVNKYSF